MGRVKLGDIARECRLTYTGNKSGIPIIGLEHLTPGDIVLHSWDIDTDNTFNKYFKKGQVLLGRRRVYLKKAAVAPFDGICSGDITVIEAIPERLQPELLPFIIQNDRFFEFAIVGSAGSLSPRVKWEYLKDYEIELPDLHKQSELVELLKSANELKHAYQEMLTATDEMVKSQFIEMFGDTFQNERGWTYKKLPEVSTIVLGSTPSSSNAAFWDGDVKWITPAELSDDSFYLYDSERHITEEGVKSTSLKPFPAGTVILSTRAPIGKTAIAGCEMYCNQGFKNFVCGNTINPVYLFYTLRIHNPELQKMGTGSTFLELSKKAIEQISISVPPKELQDEFEQFYKQTDKSKFELKQAIEKIDKVMQTLMR